MYDFEWHKQFGDRTSGSAETVVRLLNKFVSTSSVLDVGCGDGLWLAEFLTQGTKHIVGVDGSWTDLTRLNIPPETVHIHDLSEPLHVGERFDLVISLEVAEHIERRAAETFVDNLVRHGDVIFFGAAIPLQGGFRHVNEQWQSYWRDLFASKGFVSYDTIRSQIWNDEKVAYWYCQNCLMYIREDAVAVRQRIEDYVFDAKINALPMDVIHPTLYMTHATYDHISFGPMLRATPRNIAQKLQTRISGLRKGGSKL